VTEARGTAAAEASPRAASQADAPPSPPVQTGAAEGTGRPMWAVFLPLAAAITIADQLTKAWLVSFLDHGESVDVVGDWIRLIHSQNAGGLFGLLQGQALPFGLVSIVVVALIVVYHAKAGRSRYLSITLGLLLGGALGNLTDRLRLGHVVDFVDAGIGDLRWYTFNVADAAISFALLLLIAASVRPSVARQTAPDA
jgi:signal peptidase II